jgi:4-amino-4-deoxy-L-arabinose transferase-like glycosyltransferase
MELTLRTGRIAAAAALAVASALVLVGIWSFGIWDPWELGGADIARHLAAGEPPNEEGALRVPPLGPWLVAAGFWLFGVHEWSGRVPIALAGILTVAVAYWLVRRFAGARAGVYAAIVTATTPLFLFNARQMIGAAPGMAAQALVMLCAASLLFQPEPVEGESRFRGPQARLAWGLGLVTAIGLSTLASGFMLGPLPALAAVAAVAVARGELDLSRRTKDGTRWIAAIAITIVVVVCGLVVADAVAVNADAYSPWIGGAPRGGNPPTFEVVLEQVFHSFAPWSALVPMALGRALAGRGEGDATAPFVEEPVLRLALPVCAILGFAAQTIFVSRFGTATFLPVVALAGSVALFLRDVERSRRGSWGAGLVALLLSLLLVRDFRGYPAVPASGLGVEGMTAPDVFNPAAAWAGLLGVFGLLALIGLSVDREETFDTLREDGRRFGRVGKEAPPTWWRGGPALWKALRGATAVVVLGWPYRLWGEQWKRGLRFRAWLAVIALLLTATTVFGVLAIVFGEDRPYEVLSWIALVSGIVAAISWLELAGLGFARLGWDELGTPLRIVRLVLLAIPTVGGVALGRWAKQREGRMRRAGLVLMNLGIASTSLAIACGILGSPDISSLAVRIGVVLAFLLPGIVLLVAAARGTRFGFHQLGEWALVPMLVAGIAVAGYTSFRFQPLMSRHFSPSEVYDAFNRLASPGEPLGEWQVGGRAAAYYARGEVRELRDQTAVLEFLSGQERVWLAFRADDLAQLDRAYRARTDRHLFVADASSARVLLATNQPIEHLEDQNYLANAILDRAPEVQHPVGANFDRRIELVGYDLDLPGGHTVGPGQQFVVTWYWRVMAPVPGSYQIFLHVDGMGQRLNGDHEPVQGRYPVRLWDEGDIVVDRQELRVPANFPPGQYTFFIGFYAGESRLDVISGPQDEVDRVRAGTLLVR